MIDRLSFYLQKNNHLFNNNCILVVCYKATRDEIKDYGLTGENILIFIKHSKLNNLINSQKIDYYKVISNLFDNEKVLLRIQCECLLGMYGDSHCDCEQQRLNYIQLISQNNGIYVHMPQEAQGWGLFYKLKELELQVSGRMQNGEFVGIQKRNDAQKLLQNTKNTARLEDSNFEDKRNYEIIAKIFEYLGLKDQKFVLISDSDNKIVALKELNFNVVKYNSNDDFVKIDRENLSEYLVKILDGTHDFNREIIDEIFHLINIRKYNGRALSTLISIKNKIINDKSYNLDQYIKDKVLETVDKITCGEEKKYIFDDTTFKIQNNFSCKVNSSVFKAILNAYGKNVFDRISLEKLYYFKEKNCNNNSQKRIRTSTVLDTIGKDCTYFKGQIHVVQRDFNDDGTQILQKEINLSILRAMFENNNYDYLQRVEMLTIISEGRIPGINIYIKKLPNIESRIMDIFGKEDKIRDFINKTMSNLSRNVFNEAVSNMDYENENFAGHNLRFSNLDTAIDEELELYRIIKQGEH